MGSDSGVALGAFLKEEGLAHLFEVLEPHGPLSSLAATLGANRVLFLARLKEWGVNKLVERQKLANALSKAVKAGRVGAAPAVPHLNPCNWSQTEDSLVVKLSIPSGTTSSEVSVSFDVNSVEVKVKGEPSSLCGRLQGIIKAADSFWELERAPPPDPAMFAEREDQREPDTILVTLVKAKAGVDWTALFADGVGMSAKKEKPPPPPEPPKPSAPKAGSKNPGIGFVQRKLRFDKQPAGSDGRMGRDAQARGSAGSGGPMPTRPARDQWDCERAHFLWREGCLMLESEADSPPDIEGHGAGSGGGPPFWWRESADNFYIFARTRRGFDASTMDLDVRETSVDLEIDGIATPWCGTLCGRTNPSGYSVEVVPAGVSEPPSLSTSEAMQAVGGPHDPGNAPWAVLKLCLEKQRHGEGSRYWRAPFTDLLRLVDGRDMTAGYPSRGALLDTPQGGWELAQSSRDFEVLIPLSSLVFHGPEDADRFLRVAVTTSSINVHVAGRPDAPLLAGETFGRLVVGECTWKLSQSRYKDKKGAPLWQMQITLVKDAATSGVGGHWPELFRVEHI